MAATCCARLGQIRLAFSTKRERTVRNMNLQEMCTSVRCRQQLNIIKLFYHYCYLGKIAAKVDDWLSIGTLSCVEIHDCSGVSGPRYKFIQQSGKAAENVLFSTA